MKSKRVLTILLSMAIMLTFMPVMSFADVSADIQPGSKPHKWYHDDSKSIAATCYSEGLDVESCSGEAFYEDGADEEYDDPYMVLPCDAMKATYAPQKDHHTAKKNPIPISKDELIARLASEWSLDAAAVDKLYKDNADRCYAFAFECKECGRIPMNSNGTVDTEFVKWQGHKAPAGTPDCAMSYVCEFCGQTIVTGITETSSLHEYGAWSDDQRYVCGDKANGYGYIVKQRTCSKCGNVQYDKSWEGTGEYADESKAQHGNLVQFVKVQPTCVDTGLYSRRCPDCGTEVPYADGDKAAVIPALGHDFKSMSFAPNCTTDGFTYQRCSRCALENNYKYNVGSKLGHNYKVEVLFEPNCDAVGITRITCTNGCMYSRFVSNPDSDAQSHLKYVDKDGHFQTAYKPGLKIFFVGQNDEYFDANNMTFKDGAIELADWNAKTHDWGKFENMKAADCTTGTVQAAKCKVCGHYDVHTAVETGAPVGHKWTTNTQNPTCGAKGFTYDVCSVCGDYTNVKQFGEPKVAYGAKCDFSKWVVEKAATPFEEGTKKLVCRNCLDDGHLIWYEGEMKESGVTRTAIAKTKIAAPKVKAGKKKATVTVKAVEGAVKYQIKVNGKVKKTINKPLTSAKKVTFKKLKGGKKAKFQIVAYNAEGVKAASKVKSVKIKK